MGYLHIDNLYKNQEILMFKECYALEKIHGTSEYIKWCNNKITFFSGGENYNNFIGLFDEDFLINKFKEQKFDLGIEVFIFGEGYGGRMQKMSNTYGKKFKFVAFDVKVGDFWLSVPKAEEFVKLFNIEFVDYKKINVDLKELDRLRDKNSIQAIRNGMGEGKKREGIVLRPLIELKKNNGNRIIVKYKREDFRETKTIREIKDIDQLKIWEEAKEIAEEWVVKQRLNHILDTIKNPNIEKMKEIIFTMQRDIKREAKNEIIWNKTVADAIAKRTVLLFKEQLKNNLDNK